MQTTPNGKESDHMNRSQQKNTIGVLLIIVGAIAIIISTAAMPDIGIHLFAAGLVGLAAGVFEVELAAVWLKLEGGEVK